MGGRRLLDMHDFLLWRGSGAIDKKIGITRQVRLLFLTLSLVPNFSRFNEDVARGFSSNGPTYDTRTDKSLRQA